jgi:ketosteroid isomerase-like protein
MHRPRALLSAIVLAASACAATPGATPGANASMSGADQQAAVRAQSDAFTRAVNGRDAAALVALHTADAVIKYPDAPAGGVEFMRTAWQNAFGAPSVAFSDSISRIEVGSSGDVAWDYSRWSLTTGNESTGGGATRTWRRVNGVWKISSNVAWSGS